MSMGTVGTIEPYSCNQITQSTRNNLWENIGAHDDYSTPYSRLNKCPNPPEDHTETIMVKVEYFHNTSGERGVTKYQLDSYCDHFFPTDMASVTILTRIIFFLKLSTPIFQKPKRIVCSRMMHNLISNHFRPSHLLLG